MNGSFLLGIDLFVVSILAKNVCITVVSFGAPSFINDEFGFRGSGG